jgi:hypothetical protein
MNRKILAVATLTQRQMLRDRSAIALGLLGMAILIVPYVIQPTFFASWRALHTTAVLAQSVLVFCAINQAASWGTQDSTERTFHGMMTRPDGASSYVMGRAWGTLWVLTMVTFLLMAIAALMGHLSHTPQWGNVLAWMILSYLAGWPGIVMACAIGTLSSRRMAIGITYGALPILVLGANVARNAQSVWMKALGHGLYALVPVQLMPSLNLLTGQQAAITWSDCGYAVASTLDALGFACVIASACYGLLQRRDVRSEY